MNCWFRATHVLAASTLLLAPARAHGAAQLRASASNTVVAPGETFVVTVESSDVGSAEELGLDSAGKVTVLRTTHGAQSFSFSFGQGGARQSVTHSIQTYLKAPSAGTLRFTPTARVQGKTLHGASITVKVDEAAAKQRSRSRDPFDDLFGNPTDPFGPGQDPFKGLRDMLPKNGAGGGIDDLLDREFGPAKNPELDLPAPRAPYVFLHAVAAKTRLVVGESVIVRNYMYIAEGSQLRHYQPRFPVAPDFELHGLPHSDDVPTVGQVVIAGVRYTVKSGGTFLLVPLKTGTLSVAGASAIIETGGSRSLDRSAETLNFEVVEPPKEGRPAEYRIGDVGTFTVTTSAAPTAVDSGGSVTVEVTTQGDGNFPPPWVFPKSDRVQWGEGQVRDQIAYGEDGTRKGTRITRYLATLASAQLGERDVNLGDVAWSSYDVSAGKYVDIPLHLGHVQVRGAAALQAAASAPQVALPQAETRDVPYASVAVTAPKALLPLAGTLPLLGLLLRWLRARREAQKHVPPPSTNEVLRGLRADARTMASDEAMARIETLLVRIESERGELPAALGTARECVHLARYSGATGTAPELIERAIGTLEAWHKESS